MRLAPVVLLSLATACAPADADARPGRGLLVVAIDGLRADHVSCLGYDRETTPTLDRLAEEGALFEEAFANAPTLIPAHASLITGCDPNLSRRLLVAGVDAAPERSWKIPREVPHLAVELLANGWSTAAFVDHRHISSVLGFDVGFQRFVGTDHVTREKGPDDGAAALSGKLLAWMRGLERDADWFGYLHLHDLERSWRFPQRDLDARFEARPELDDVPAIGNTDEIFFAVPRSRWLGGTRTLGRYEALYDHHLRELDAELDRLLGSLEVLGRREDTTVVVVGTHGLQFGEAGLMLASGLYSVHDLAVPWIVAPGRGVDVVPGTRQRQLAASIDLAPTLLELVGLPRPAGMHGVSHAARLAGDPDAPPPRRWLFASCGWMEGGAMIGERWCLERTQPGDLPPGPLRDSWFGEPSGTGPAAREVFYDRLVTPVAPLSGRTSGRPDDAAERLAAAARWYVNVQDARRVLQSAAWGPTAEGEATIERLRAEGYLGDEP